MSYRVVLRPAAARALQRMPEKISAACWEFIHGPLAENPHRAGKPLLEPLAPQYSARRRVQGAVPDRGRTGHDRHHVRHAPRRRLPHAIGTQPGPLGQRTVGHALTAFTEFFRVLRPGGALVISAQHPVMDWLRKGGSYFEATLETDTWRTPYGGQPVQFWREPLSALCTAANPHGSGAERRRLRLISR